MTSSQRSKWGAVAVFTLIALVVIAGMTWATTTSLQLAKQDLREGRMMKVYGALWRMDSHVGGILRSEAARVYTDYVAVHLRDPLAVRTEQGYDTRADPVVLRSPIALSGSPNDWIELYFQISPDGTPTSPQVDDSLRWLSPNFSSATDSQRRARIIWEWLQTVLPDIGLRERVADALKRERTLHASTNEPEQTQVVRVSQHSASKSESARQQASTEYQLRKRTHQQSLSGYVPLPACFIVDEEGKFDTLDPDKEWKQVEISLGSFAPPFWLDGPGNVKKLAFVRECSADSALFHQGFIGDWNKLKADLLEVIHDLFPDADLQPVAEDVNLDEEMSKRKMSTVPAILSVPEIAGESDTAAAWRQAGGVLVTTWAAALAALGAAGWGIRNLVALTERRMQFAYAVTHELRTPLTTFRLYSDMLSAGLVPDSSKQEYLDTLNRESIRLTGLVESVLEYARLENRKVRLSPITTDGESLLRAVGETLKQRCTAYGIEPHVQNDISSEQKLRIDVDVLNQIAGVLINNACRHARNGKSDNGKSPKVLIRLAGDADQLYMDVIDTGPGVERTDSRAIFKPFRRGRNADVIAQGGIGLGLALARDWAALLNGHLELAARHHPQYGGAHFRLIVPCANPT